jgi:regulator of sigma E protease
MNIVFFLLLIGPLIFFHELGHFIFAKLFGVRVLCFSLGFGPRLVSFTRNGTEYCICWLPLGGYVRMLGQDPTEELSDDDRGGSFTEKPLWQRALIYFAGPLANLVLPVLIFFIYFGFSDQFTKVTSTVVGSVSQGMPAYDAGIRPGDKITAVNGEPVRYFEQDLMRLISPRAGQSTTVEVDRRGETLSFTLTPVEGTRPTRFGSMQVGQIGIGPRFLSPQVGINDQRSPAWQAGLRTQDLLLAINGEMVTRWVDVETQLSKVAPGSEVRLTFVRGASLGFPLLSAQVAGPTQEVSILAPEKPSAASFGFDSSEMFVAYVRPGSPAEKAGILMGDHILGYLPEGAKSGNDGCAQVPMQKALGMWDFLSRDLMSNPGAARSLLVKRPGVACEMALELTPGPQSVDPNSGQSYSDEMGQLGMVNLSSLSQTIDLVTVDGRLWFAARESVYQTVFATKEIAAVFGRLVQGRVPMKTLGSPIMIYKIAGQAAESSWEDFLGTMALISINIGILNLLPIPLLDGGHLLFFAVEAVRRRPVSLRFREIASFVGISMIFLLVLVAFKNDLERYWPW